MIGIITAFASRNEYLFLGLILMHIKTQVSFTAALIQDYVYEEYLTEFPSLFRDQHTEQTSSPINSVFIIEAEAGSFQKLKKLCNAISEVFQIGGYGVKIENSGKFISRECWEGLSFSSQTLFELFVSVYPTDTGIITCGMGNFGKRDVFVPLKPDDDAINFILTYAWYILNERPEINEGETFSLSKNSPSFKIFESEDQMREAEHPFYNPYGIWKMWPQEWLDS